MREPSLVVAPWRSSCTTHTSCSFLGISEYKKLFGLLWTFFSLREVLCSPNGNPPGMAQTSYHHSTDHNTSPQHPTPRPPPQDTTTEGTWTAKKAIKSGQRSKLSLQAFQSKCSHSINMMADSKQLPGPRGSAWASSTGSMGRGLAAKQISAADPATRTRCSVHTSAAPLHLPYRNHTGRLAPSALSNRTTTSCVAVRQFESCRTPTSHGFWQAPKRRRVPARGPPVPKQRVEPSKR